MTKHILLIPTMPAQTGYLLMFVLLLLDEYKKVLSMRNNHCRGEYRIFFQGNKCQKMSCLNLAQLYQFANE